MPNLDENPLFAHLTRGSRWPSLKVTLLLALGGAAAVWIAWLLAGEEWHGWFGSLITTSAIIVLVVSPLILSYVGTSFTRRELQSEAYQLLHLTPLSKQTIVEGFVFAWLHRFRLLLAATVALSSGLPLAGYREAQSHASTGCVVFVSPQDTQPIQKSLEAAFQEAVEHGHFPNAVDALQGLSCASPSDSRLLWGPLLIALLVVAAWGVNGLVMALVVSLILWRPGNVSVRTLVAIVAAAGIIVMLTLAGPYLPSVNLSCLPSPSRCMYVVAWPPPFPTAVVAAWLVYPATWGVMRLAGRG